MKTTLQMNVRLPLICIGFATGMVSLRARSVSGRWDN
jgi:hypothetical protein